jgi:AraC-like DNA-binding protein
MDSLMLVEMAHPRLPEGGRRKAPGLEADRVRFWRPAAELADEIECAYLDGGIASPHVHEDWQFAVAGVPSALSIGAFRRYIAGPTDITVVPPYDVHTEHGMLGEPRDWYVLHVAPALVNRIYGEPAGQPPRFDSPVVSDHESAGALAALLQGGLEGATTGEEFVSQAVDWLRALLHGPAVRRSVPVGTNGPRAPVDRARAYLQAHATEPILLADLVEIAGVTTSHFVRSFSRRVGLPPKSYQAQIRLARARRHLAEGRPATWVAYECGFADQSHLSRRFKEFYGLTPGAFQAQFQAPRPVATGIGCNAA